MSKTKYVNSSSEELDPSCMYSKDPSELNVNSPKLVEASKTEYRESESISTSLDNTPLPLSTLIVPPSSTEYSSDTPSGLSLPGLIVIDTVAVSELKIPSET